MEDLVWTEEAGTTQEAKEPLVRVWQTAIPGKC